MSHSELYESIFSSNDIKRYEDYGRFYKSLAFYLRSNPDKGIVDGYNSRPRDMINNVLQDIQKGNVTISEENLLLLLNATIQLRHNYGTIPNSDYIIDAIIPFIDSIGAPEDIPNLEEIFTDDLIKKTLKKSPATTSNVNERLRRVKEILTER